MSDIKNLERTLWAAADKLPSNMDAAEYKNVVLGLIFLKYTSRMHLSYVTSNICYTLCSK